MVKFGQNKYLIISLFLFLSVSLFSQPKEPLSILTKTLERKEKNCTFKVKYPLLKLRDKSKYKSKHIKVIKKFLIDEFTNLESYYNEFECNQKDKNAPAFSLNGDFEVKLKNNSVISLYSIISSFTEGNAHPENIYKTYNFDLRTGKEIPFESLFKTGGTYLIPLNKFMAENLLFEKNINDKEEFIAVKKNKYTFYLSPKGIHFINLFDIHAMQSVEANVPYDKILKYINSNILTYIND